MSYWDDWFKRFLGRGGIFFPDIKRLMDEMEREMAESFKDIEDRIPEDMIRRRRLPGGKEGKEYGPFVYGYSVRIGPDGKPRIRTFGNLKPSSSEEGQPLDLHERREPLVDILDEDEELKVVAELPGVDKEDIQLYATEDSLTIDVNTPERRYHKEVELPTDVDKSTAKSKYMNGVLDIVFKKKKRDKGTRLEIE
jgi:HSP20 family protein